MGVSTAPDNLGALLAAAVRRFPGLAAIDGAMTYAQLQSEAERVRDALAAAGLAANEPVHVRTSNQPRDLAAYFGVWLGGAVVVPVHRSSPEAAVAPVLAKTRARFEWDDALRRLGDAPPPARPILEGAALIVFTSGSSGMPKGAVLSHRAFAGKLAAIQSLLRFGESASGERTMLVLNLTFSFGIWVALLTLIHGGCLLMREKFAAGGFLADLGESHATRVAVVPTMMRSLVLDLPSRYLQCNAPALRQVLIGGETLGKSLGETLRGLFAPAHLIDIYGLTETSTCDFFLMPKDAERYSGCIGRPSPGVRYRIEGEDGELWISSPYLMNGYLDEPKLQPIRDGWLATGDLARERDPGVVEVVGRKKELIYRGGIKIAPLEIELACGAHPRVAAALAVGRPDERLGERIHALVVPRNDGTAADLTPAEVHAFLAARLERYKRPDVLYFARELPAGRTGKADRGRFAAMLAANELIPAEEADQPMNKYESIRVTCRDGVAQLELHRPERINALGKSMLLEINHAMDALESDAAVRVIVLCGAGRGFSSGFDLKEQMARRPEGAADWREILELDFSTTMRFWDSPKPTIAAIHGPCMAGAFEMALACDISVASRDAVFGEPELKFGAGIVTLLLPWMVGPKAAKDILLTGDDSLNAERALALGIVSRVVPEGEHLATALALAKHIAVIDPDLVRDTKKALNRTYEIAGMRAALAAALDIDHAIESHGSPDKRAFMDLAREQGLKAALAWREARFKGGKA